MLIEIPSQDEIKKLIGKSLFDIWQKLCAAIEEQYDMERTWNYGGKKWAYEYKYRRGGKSLCALYAEENCIGFIIIFGKDEREKVEGIRNDLSKSVCRTYGEAVTYHDGKWVMFKPTDTAEFNDYLKQLSINRKANRK